MKKYLTLQLLLLLLSYKTIIAQAPTCSPAVPFYVVDLRGNPTGSWVSPGHSRNGNCCSTTSPDRCTSFEIYIDTGAAMISFEIASGAIPPGSMFYQINCGPQVPVGQPICITGAGPHFLTFCKPGNNQNTYRVTSIAKPTFPPDDTVRIGCSHPIPILGMVESSVTWNSIFPGAPGAYNSYLNCTSNCDTSIYTPAINAPPYVEYLVCGNPIATLCGYVAVCDTVRIYNEQPLSVTASPNPAGFCQGGPGVTLSASATGGLAPYSYVWRDQSLTQTCTGTSCLATNAGTYSIEVRDLLYDSTYCPAAFASATVVVTPPPVVNAGPDQTLCPTNPVVILNGSVQYATGGTWSGGAGTFNPNNSSLLTAYTPTPAEIAAGQVTLTLTSTGAGGGCTDNADQVTIHFPTPLIVNVADINVGCNGGSGTLTSTVSGGTAPYSYQWSTGQASTSITAGQGSYCLSVTDNLGCTATDCGTITTPAALNISMSSTACTTNGGTDGTASATVTGGTAPYSYSWSNGGTTQTITGLAYGVYQVTVTDNNGCSIVSSVVVNEPRCNSFSVGISGNSISCSGGNDGSATATVISGTPNYTYLWNDPLHQMTATAGNLTAGVYQCLVMDALGCIAAVNVSLTQPASLTNTMTHTNASSIGGNDGSATSNVNGGTPGYTYTWSNGGNTASISSLTAGTYSLVVHDTHNCTLVDSVLINQPPCNNLTAGVVSSNVSCNGGSNGTASVIVLFGNNPLSYLWSTGATASSVSGLAAGNYNVTVTDGSNCSTFVNFSITQPAPLSVSLAPTDIRCNHTNDGTIELTVNGGTFPYSYMWSNGLTVEDQVNLSNGTYSVTVTDAMGCVTNGTTAIVRPAPISISSVITPVTCNGGSNGAVDATVSGGIAPYTYSWSNAATTQDISGLVKNEYLLTVTDANNCVTAPFSSLVDEPDTVKVAGAVAVCPVPGSGLSQVTFTATGGNAGSYQFSVNGGTSYLGSGVYNTLLPVDSSYTVIVRDTFGCVAPASVTLNIAPAVDIVTVTYPSCIPDGASAVPVNLTVTGGNGGLLSASFDNGATWQAPGVYAASLATGASYSIIVKDSSGCNSVTENISLSTDIVLAGTTSAYAGGFQVSCAGASTGSIDLTANGGTGGYSYNWSNAVTTQDLAAVPAGTYSVVVSDNSGCADTIAFTLNEPAALTGTVVPTALHNGYAISCFGGNNGVVDLSVSGGVANYSYNWSNSATSQDLSSLTAGSYSVTVTDANGCTLTQSITLTQPAQLAMTAAVQQVLCNSFSTGAINLTTTGGVTNYNYSWDNSATTEDLSALTAGNYSVTITDGNGCMIDSLFSITQPSAVVVTNVVSDFNGYNISCNGGTNGNIDLSVNGGTTPYNFSWSNTATSEDLANIIAGSYSVTVVDGNGCTQTHSFTLTEPSALTGSVVPTALYNGYAISCFGGNNGAVDLSVNGGVTNYNYSWNNSATSQDLSSLTAGNYSVTVTDANGCTLTQSITLTQPAQLAMTAAVQQVLCNGFNTGAINLTTTGGVTNYSYSWDNSATTEDLSALTAGNYSVTITDANGCMIDSLFSITQPGAVVVTNVVSDFNGYNISCNGGSNGNIDLSVNGGTTPYNFSWSNTATSEDLANIIAGSYSVTVVDGNGCTQTHSFTLTEPTALTGSVVPTALYNGYAISCFGGNNGAVDLSVNGGVTNYNYSWSNSATSQDLSSLIAGNYSVTVTDANGCTLTQSITLTQPAQLAMTAAVQQVLCNGFNTGAINLTTTGGVTNYNYSWDNSATTEDLSALTAGNYSVTITDANGCVIDSLFTITEPTALAMTSVLSDYNGYNVSCNGSTDGQIDLTVSGGASGYTFQWSNAATSEDLVNVAAGNYTVTITDANSCTLTQTFTLTSPVPLSGSLVSVNNFNGYDVSCFGSQNGAVDLTINGGAGAYTYNWSNSATTQDLTNLSAGSYSVSVTDQNGCLFNGSISLSEPAAVTIAASVTNVACNGFTTGVVDLTTTGGVQPYGFSWSNGQTTEDIDSLGAGAYLVTITDANGCLSDSSFTIAEQSPVVLGLTSTSPLCSGNADGSINMTVAGGTTPYTYNWSNGATTEDLSNLGSGSYIVTVTDVNNCSATDTLQLAEPAPLTTTIASPVTTDGYNVSGYGAHDGSIDLNVEGGTLPYTYSWNNGSTTEDLQGAGAGNYGVTITDANGCTTSTTIALTEPLQLEMPTGFSPNGDGFNDYFVVHGLEIYPNNKIEVYNRWGNLVYDSEHYANRWNGTNKDGQQLPDGTYFVILDINQGSIVLKGYVDIRR